MSNWKVNLYSQWTESSKFCYRRGCNCQGCYVKDIIETQCFMKEAVLTLVKEFGAPPNDEEHLTRTQQKVIEAILAGADTREDIAKLAGTTSAVVQHCLNDMYEIAENDGLVYPSKKYKLKHFIKWVRKGEL